MEPTPAAPKRPKWVTALLWAALAVFVLLLGREVGRLYGPRAVPRMDQPTER